MRFCNEMTWQGYTKIIITLPLFISEFHRIYILFKRQILKTYVMSDWKSTQYKNVLNLIKIKIQQEISFLAKFF